MYFLRILRKNKRENGVDFYHCNHNTLWHLAVVCHLHCSWKESAPEGPKKCPKIIACPLLSLEDVYNRHCLRRAHSILSCELLSSGRRYRAIRAKTNNQKNCFYPKALIAINTAELNIWNSCNTPYQPDPYKWLIFFVTIFNLFLL